MDKNERTAEKVKNPGEFAAGKAKGATGFAADKARGATDFAREKARGASERARDASERARQRAEAYQSSGFRMTWNFSIVVFLTMLITMGVVVLVVFLFYRYGEISPVGIRYAAPVAVGILLSLILGAVLSMYVSTRTMKPVRDVMDAIDKVSEGDLSVRLDIKKPIEFEQLSASFNDMAQELNSVEMLRNDFVNNFSHEFKTPIVSIRGFAKLLENDDLTDAERREYLDIIIAESERLADMAANVLMLSKLEQQAILNDKTEFNVTEQIRLAVVMMVTKWSDKDIDLDFDCGEYMVTGTEKLLKEVWINLLDNAIKFAPEGGRIRVVITQQDNTIEVAVGGQGDPIPEDQAERIFDKFYQGDTSHAEEGHGLGLAIARRIAELHGGSIVLRREDDMNVFAVTLSAK